MYIYILNNKIINVALASLGVCARYIIYAVQMYIARIRVKLNLIIFIHYLLLI
jgi:hypothetical protein